MDIVVINEDSGICVYPVFASLKMEVQEQIIRELKRLKGD